MDWAALLTSMENDLTSRRTANAVVDTPASSEIISPVALVKLVALMAEADASDNNGNTTLTNIYNQLVLVNTNLTTINNTLVSGINVTIVT